jgi:hypothetical protein
MDMHDKFPFSDNFFDFSLCTHTLEDIKDPISVCKELIRVSKAGYIECPSREVESILNLKKQGLVGYGNHRWFVDICDRKNEVVFTNKTPYIYTDQSLTLPRNHKIKSTYVGLFWKNSFNASEKIIISTNETIKNQHEFIKDIKSSDYCYDCNHGMHKA